MIILHAGFLDHRLLLWGESPARVATGPTPHRGRKPKASAPVFPADAGAAGLAASLEQAGVPVQGRQTRAGSVIVWLPTKGDRPVPSSPLVAEAPDSGGSPALSPWTITILPLSSEDAIGLLCTSAGKQTLAPGVIVGRDLAFCARVMRFAAALVARQQYLPSLESRDGDCRAVWEPVITGEDWQRLTALASAMPPACRALSSEAEAGAPDSAPLTVLLAFLAAMVDHLVRAAGPEVPGTVPGSPRRRRKTGEFASLHDQWLHALRSSDGIMQGEAAELDELARQVKQWRRPIAVAASSPLRLCFRLEEPVDGVQESGSRRKATGDSWYVNYLLQPRDDQQQPQ